jgi:chondroitin 4-sulfotransferase 11
MDRRMTINHEKKLIFIHIPKNAGTSIIKAMGVENMYMDKTIKEYKEHYEDYWNEYKKFTVVREPIDRFISAYKFARMDESGWFSATGEESLEKHHHYELCNEMNINEYISYLYKNPEKFNRWISPQTFIISNENGEREIDYYVKYENLLEDLQKIGIDKIEKLNSSKIKDEKTIELTKKSKNMLYQIYDIDYQNFSYIKDTKQLFSYQ